jgi:TonB family protein
MTPPIGDTPRSFTNPRLGVRWQGGLANFFESCGASLAGPRAARGFDPAFSFFRLRLSPGQVPARGIAGSLLWHVALLAAIIPLGRLAEPAPKFTLPQIQITWYGPATDIAPVPAAKKDASKPSLRPSPNPRQPVIARAYNPKTTVIFQPPHATNTRQVLIEPDAPPTPPKSLPALPNIIAWAQAAPVRPAIAVNPNELLARKPRNGSVANAMAPRIANAPPPAAPLNVGDNPNAPPAPPLPPATGAIRAERKQPAPENAAAPTVAYVANRVVALSLTPGDSVPPPGNASAPISIGPRVGKPVSIAPPDISAGSVPGAGAPGASGATPGPTGLLIVNEGAVPAPVPPPAPRAPAPLPHIAAPSPIVLQPPSRSAAGGSGIVPHDLAHRILGMRPIQTLLMNMPNLTSATGSWVLNFAELPGEKIPLDGSIVAPLPLRKVDPEYPPDLIQEGVHGEVVLYAVIGHDGTVSRIRVVQSLDPVLDRNAEAAFAKWKFQPALADNQPIDLEVLVHIPFRSQPPPP